MLRIIVIACGLAALGGCSGDGRGSQYSSARAQQPQSYVAVAPTIGQGAASTRPVSIAPAATQTGTGGAAAPAVSTTTLNSAGPAPIKVAAIAPVSPAPGGARFATGPIYKACLNAGRSAATKSRCGCVQWVADQRLTSAQQRRGAGYFSEQHALQETRQSDRAADEAFWTAWKDFGQAAGQQCRST